MQGVEELLKAGRGTVYCKLTTVKSYCQGTHGVHHLLYDISSDAGTHLQDHKAPGLPGVSCLSLGQLESCRPCFVLTTRGVAAPQLHLSQILPDCP